jgi:hypothetical protein
MSPAETIASINETTLDAISTVQDSVLDAYKSAVAVLPANVPSVPYVLPIGQADVTEIVTEIFAFQSKVLEANKRFVLGLVDATAGAAPAPAKVAK